MDEIRSGRVPKSVDLSGQFVSMGGTMSEIAIFSDIPRTTVDGTPHHAPSEIAAIESYLAALTSNELSFR